MDKEPPIPESHEPTDESPSSDSSIVNEPRRNSRIWARREFIYGAVGFAAGATALRAYYYVSQSPANGPVPPVGPSPQPTIKQGLTDIAEANALGWIEPEVRKSDPATKELRTQLVIDYADLNIDVDPVRLRCYEGKLTGPTMRARPGDTLYITLINKLPRVEDQPPICDHETHATNLHTHGLHVDPTDGDDVLRNIVAPGGTKTFRYVIPEDHHPGTFWYHPHKHGSVALQVANGMAGALIIEGDIDRVPEIAAARERIFVFQQIPYNEKKPGTVECADLEAAFARDTTINGALEPTIIMEPGEVQRWRFIHAGIKEKLKIKLDGHQLYVIAHDGITTGHMVPVDNVELNPGYRTDVLVKAKKLDDPTKPETFKLRDMKSTGLLEEIEKGHQLAAVLVTGAAKDMKLPDESVLTGLFPLKDLSHETISQTVRMDFDTKIQAGGVTEFQICLPGGNTSCDKVNCKPFDSRTISVKLNTVDEWVIATCNKKPSPAHHPFHIHVNPFQIMSINGSPPDPSKGEKVWGDTLLVERGDSTKPAVPVVLRTNYTRWTGETVLHCHILDHEDQGMMIKVNIQS